MTDQVVNVVDVAASHDPEAIADSRLEARVLRTLFRKGHMLEGLLANYVKDRMNTATWQECLARLLAVKFIEIIPVFYYGNARRIGLTDLGFQCAQDLCRNRRRPGGAL